MIIPAIVLSTFFIVYPAVQGRSFNGDYAYQMANAVIFFFITLLFALFQLSEAFPARISRANVT